MNTSSHFPTVRRSALAGLVALAVAGCALVTGDPDAPEEEAVPDRIDAPALAEGASDATRDGRAAELLTEAEARLRADDPAGALRVTRQIRDDLATASGTVRVLWVEARAREAEESFPEADRAATEYVDRAGEADPMAPAARLLSARVRFSGGLDEAYEALFQVPEGAPSEVRDDALALARDRAASLDDPVLRDLVSEAPPHAWLLPVFQVEWATRRGLLGERDRARELAEAALGLEPAEDEERRARAIMEDEFEPRGTVTGTMGLILSMEGSPSIRQLSEQIRNGVEIALLAEGIRGGVRLESLEDRGETGGARTAARRVVDAGALGLVGPVSDPAFRAVAGEVGGQMAVISPVAGERPDTEGVLTLAGIDPEAPRELARMARDMGVEAVGIVHSSALEERTEARWFREAFEEMGGRIHATRSWSEGDRVFDDAFEGLMGTSPPSVVIFSSPDEAELIAPLLRVWGLRDLDGPILASSSWASEAVLGSVPARHTDGILSVAPHVGAGYGPGWDAFVQRYEDHFRRSLRNPVAGLGHDAAALLLEAARLGGDSPGEVVAGLRSIDGFAGATGTFRWRDDRIVRVHYPVRIEDGRRVGVRD
ncbi:MAG: amino acid ABC transporter substrate-binding protein [Gemmatimonadales bacterium]|nr:MAG: amino acid ABC transporter substrate-binding protein [Gemmatimonadales bacterium]